MQVVESRLAAPLKPSGLLAEAGGPVVAGGARAAALEGGQDLGQDRVAQGRQHYREGLTEGMGVRASRGRRQAQGRRPVHCSLPYC